MHRRIFVVPPLPPNSFSPPPLRSGAAKASSFSPTIAYILLVVFIIVFFFFDILLHAKALDEPCGWKHPRASGVESRGFETSGGGRGIRSSWEGVAEGEDVKMTAHCRHIFHANCIDTWLENHVTCPVCRYSEMGGEEELVTVGGGSAGKFSNFTPKLAYIFLIIFIILFFFVFGLEFFYMQRRSSSTNSKADDIHWQGVSNPVALRSLTVVVMVADTAGECTICLEGVGEGEEVKMTAHCKHTFHANCIDNWLENHVTCPVCRYSEMTEEEVLVTVGGGEQEDAEVSRTNLE
ncbi:LOW QUALITY PROTEIN: hypothetical protein PHAVU_011G169222 [Phaseolus vulgaris]